MAGWERRQQDGEYDSVSISSSLVRGGKRAASETGAVRTAVVPFAEAPRRAGSEADLAYADPRHYAAPMPPAAARMPFHIPPHPMMGFPPPPPPHLFRGSFPPHPPPHMMAPPMRLPPDVRMPPPPPHMFPMMPPPFAPRGYFLPPPPPHFMAP
ncbi:hypothetical protein Y032_0010g1227, partial [Ancylostoma ceylanicum]